MLLVAMAIVFDFTSEAWGSSLLSWLEVQLVDAFGVPNDPIHGYTFKGILKIYGKKKKESGLEPELNYIPVHYYETVENIPYATMWVTGEGKWNGNKNEAEEKLILEGDVAGEFYSLLKCTTDPWISTTSCAVLKAQYNSKKGTLWDFPGMVKKWQQPLTQYAVNLAKAQELSKKHASTNPPPPPPPKVIKTDQQPQPTVSEKPALGVVAAITKPNLSVIGVQVKIESNCQAPQPAMIAMVTIKNSGAPLPANKGTVFIKEQGGSNLGSAGIPLPAIDTGQTQTVNIPAITLQPYSTLEGSHKVQVILNPQSEGGQFSFNKPADPYLFSVVFPSGHCKSVESQQQPQQPRGQPKPAQPQRR